MSSLAPLSLEERIVIHGLQEPPGLLMSCCVAPPAGTEVVEIPYEDQGLSM